MLLNVVCFLSLCVCGWIGSTLVSSCRCCVLVSCASGCYSKSSVLYYL